MKSVMTIIAFIVVSGDGARAVPCNSGTAPVCTYTSFQDFSQFGGPISVIDFETMPNGQPTVNGTFLSPLFNYGSQGAIFSSPNVAPELVGNPGDFDLFVDTHFASIHTSIIADLVTPCHAVGVAFPGGTTLSAYDAQNNLIGSIHLSGSGSGFFVGITSDALIARAVADSGSFVEDIEAFYFNPTPEPASVTLLLVGLAAGCSTSPMRPATSRRS
ncbi:MAG: hypothetical protein U1A27_10115 [Phycisphaerae bacterium]